MLHHVGWGTAAGMLALMLGGLWLYTFTLTGSLPGLSHGKALIVNVCGSSVGNLLPGGGAAGVAATYALCRSWGFVRRDISTSVIVSGVWNILARVALPVIGVGALLFGAGGLPKAVVRGGVAGAVVAVLLMALFVSVIVSERAATLVGRVLDTVLRPLWRRSWAGRELTIDELVRDLRARITDVVRHGWVSMTFGLVGFFGVYYVLFWFCLHAVGVHMSFGQIFAAYAVGRLLTAVGVTPGGVGVTESGTAAVLVAWGAAPAGALAGVVLFSVYTHLMEIPLGRDRLAGLGPVAQAPPQGAVAASGHPTPGGPRPPRADRIGDAGGTPRPNACGRAGPPPACRCAGPRRARVPAAVTQAVGHALAPAHLSGSCRPGRGRASARAVSAARPGSRSAGEPADLAQPRLVGDGVVDLRGLELAAGGTSYGQRDQGVGEAWVRGQDRAVQVGAEHRAGDGTLGAVVAVVAQPGADRAERLLPVAEQRGAGVVLVADDVAVRGVEDDRADHPLGVALGGDVEDAEAGQAPALDGDEGVAEQLVHAADHQHRCAVGGQRPERVGVAGEVVLDPGLAAVLAAAADEQVRVLGQVLAGVVRRDDRLVAVPAQPGRQAAGVAQVAVDAHLARVEVDDVDPALAHWESSPKFASP